MEFWRKPWPVTIVQKESWRGYYNTPNMDTLLKEDGALYRQCCSRCSFKSIVGQCCTNGFYPSLYISPPPLYSLYLSINRTMDEKRLYARALRQMIHHISSLFFFLFIIALHYNVVPDVCDICVIAGL